MWLDTVIACFSKKCAQPSKKCAQPLITTDRSPWQWVGDWRRKKRYILYFHGGGFCAHMPATFRYWADLPLPACAFALSPSLDLTLSSPSMTGNAKTDVMGNKDLLTRIAQIYAPEGNFLDGMVSPLFGDYRDFPPIHLQVSSEELLRDDSVRFYKKFKDETPVELVLWDDVPHCHQIFGFLPESVLARARLRSFIAAQF